MKKIWRFIYLCLRDFFHYIKSPVYQWPKKRKNRQDIAKILVLFLFDIIITLAILFFIIAPITFLWGEDKFAHALDDIMDIPMWAMIAIMFLLVLYEEIIFRLPLLFSPFRFSLGMGLLWFNIPIFLLELLSAFDIVFHIPWYIAWMHVSLSILFILFSGLIIQCTQWKETLKKLHQKAFPFIFYVLTGMFAFIHALNFMNIQDIWFFIPILIAPQLIGGLILGYIRMQYGFLYAYMSHIVFNLIFFVPTIMLV